MKKNTSDRRFEIFSKTFSILYLVGFLLHTLDVMDLRLKFSEMNSIWKTWILFLLVSDLITSVGLWFRKDWGELFFLIVTLSQLIAYTYFTDIFGDQVFLIGFHAVAMTTYCVLKKFRPTSAF